MKPCSPPNRHHWFFAILLVIATQGESHAATVRTWTGASATSGNWTAAANWQNSQPPVAGDILNFAETGGRKASNTNNFPIGTVFSTLNVFGTGYRLRGNGVTISNYVSKGSPVGTNIVDLDLTAAGPGVGITLRNFNSADLLTLNGDINLNGRTLETEGPGDFIISGVISGAGGIFKDNTGELFLEGFGANTFTGTTTVGAGILRLNRYTLAGGLTLVGTTAIPGNLVVGDFASTLIGRIVALERENQIADNAKVTVRPTGSLELSGENETIGELELHGGTVTTGSGVLNVDGQIRAIDPVSVSKNSTLAGRLNLGGRGDNPQLVDVGPNAQLTISAQISGTTTAHLIKTNRGDLVLTSSNVFHGDLEIQGGTVRITHAHALGSTNGVTRPALGTLAIQGTLGIPESFVIPGTFGLLEMVSGSSSILGNVLLNDHLTITTSSNSTLNIVGRISGPAGWTKYGDGTLQFKTPYTNTYLGTSWVREGSFIMDGVFNQPVIPGPLTIGNASDPTNSTRAWMIKHHQIADDAPVTVNRSGVLQLTGFDDTVGPLTFNGGAIETDNGTLTISGNILANATNEIARLTGRLALGGTQRTIYTLGSSNVPDLVIAAVISDGGASAGFNKIGEGSLRLSGANIFSGPVSITDGQLRVAHPNALGTSASGTSISGMDGARIVLEASVGMTIAAEPLALNSTAPGSPIVLENFTGNNRWDGPISLVAPESVIHVPSPPRPLALGGPVSGPGGLTKTGLGSLTLDGAVANSFSGSTRVHEGTLLLSKSPGITAVAGELFVGDGLGGAKADVVRLMTQHQIRDTSEVILTDSGWFDGNSRSEGLGSLAGQGLVTMGGGFLWLGSNNLSRTFSGILSNAPGANGMAKIGSGTQVFSGDNPFTGGLSIENGSLQVDGNQSLSFAVVRNGGTLRGSGVVGGINVLSGGRLSPGSSPGILTAAQNVTLATGGILRIELNGPSAGTGYDQLNLLNAVQLGGATLEIVLGYLPSIGDEFTIINKVSGGAVGGTFQGLPDGSLLSASGTTFRIVYGSGTGNDVVIRRVQVPASALTSITPMTGDRMRILGQGVPLATYVLEAAPDLGAPTSWAPIATNSADQLGWYEFIDAYTDNGTVLVPARFYRVQSP